MVKRMKTVFKAPIDDADIPVIVDYLAKTYGNEQPR
jgi:sulfite dehydrogenase (cytochrome) subunit B